MHTFRHCILALLLAATTPWQALHAEEVYQRTGKDGVPSFSDQPGNDAKAVKVEPVNVQNFPMPPKIKPLSSNKKPDPLAADKYKSLRISSPEHESTLQNTGDFAVAVELTPALKPNHKIRILGNGHILAESAGLTVFLENQDRGEHTLQAQVVNENGQVLLSSDNITLHIHRHSILHNPAN